MSNTIAGDIFARIIENVVEASRTDFEENGVSRQTLEELRTTWQQKLSERRVAQMPWDPPPTVEPEVVAGPSQSSAPTPGVGSSSQARGSKIKNETELDPAVNGNNVYMHQANPPNLASARAAALLEETFGNQANASADAIRQRGIALPGGGAQPTSTPMPDPSDGGVQLPQQASFSQTQIKQEDLSFSQLDGAGDAPQRWNEVMSTMRSADAAGVADRDATIRLAAANSNDGLMLPLSVHLKGAGKQRQRVYRGPSSSAMTQVDGAGEVKEEADEDAINSDLDEPGEDEQDDDDMQSMLCTYDKVHRAKNRWKCYLKDGILLADGKEYLFHKAQGDFEF